MMTTGKLRVRKDWTLSNEPWKFFNIKEIEPILEDRNIDKNYNGEQSLNDVVISKLVEFVTENLEEGGEVIIPDTVENQFWIRITKQNGDMILALEEPAA